MARLSLFWRVFLLFAAGCIVPSLAVMWYSAERIDARIRDHNRAAAQVLSLVSSAAQKARNGLGNVLKLPSELVRELSEADKPGHGGASAVLNRFVCAADLREVAGDIGKSAKVATLLALMDPGRAGDRPPLSPEMVREFFLPLQPYLTPGDSAEDAATPGETERRTAARIRADRERRYRTLSPDGSVLEEVVDTSVALGHELPVCNHVLVLDADGKVVAASRRTRYGGSLPDFTGRRFDELPGLGRPAAGSLARLWAVLQKEIPKPTPEPLLPVPLPDPGAAPGPVRKASPSAAPAPGHAKPAPPDAPTRAAGSSAPDSDPKTGGAIPTAGRDDEGKPVALPKPRPPEPAPDPKRPVLRMAVGDRCEGLDLAGLYKSPTDPRRWGMAVLAELPAERPASLPAASRFVLFLVNWNVVQSELASDQLYKRSRNLDRLRMLLLARPSPKEAPLVVAGGVPALMDRRLTRDEPAWGSGLAGGILELLNGKGGDVFEAPPGRPAPPDDLLAPGEASAGEPSPEILIGAVKPVPEATLPPGWIARGESGGNYAPTWWTAITYDLDEGSVAPAVRAQVVTQGVLLAAVMLAACWGVARMLAKPIRALQQMARGLAEGQWRPAEAASVGADPFRGAPREIVDLDRAFLEMAAQVVSKRELEEANIALSEKNRRLDEAVGELTAARDEIGRRAAEVGENARRLEATLARLRDTQQELLVSNMLASLGVISGEYAHAVNNGLQLPLAVLQQLESERAELHLPDALAEDIGAGVESLKHTAAFVTQFRDFARSDNYAMTPLDLNAVVQSVAAGWKPQLRRRQIELETAPGRPPIILGNESLLMHALLNLLLNARDAIRERRKQPDQRRLTGRILLRTEADDSGGRRAAVLRVEDNGCGIPPEIAPKLFQAMFTTKPKGEGSGLGLSSVLRAVRAHGGAIWFESAPGQGTTFFIRIPADGEGKALPRSTVPGLP